MLKLVNEIHLFVKLVSIRNLSVVTWCKIFCGDLISDVYICLTVICVSFVKSLLWWAFALSGHIRLNIVVVVVVVVVLHYGSLQRRSDSHSSVLHGWVGSTLCVHHSFYWAPHLAACSDERPVNMGRVNYTVNWSRGVSAKLFTASFAVVWLTRMTVAAFTK